ncbi:hypothetical protein NW752_008506 [Fusarium irregulare]|uniref:Uncharacterized protein n=1 Tax=Fusarium irregulare TaxID=2494466 RepID=A0A9W8UDL1_9HYPO|nr:hypothetical protein NW752_008506 [Fusarium irregulare]KAJ4020438.1 hypothetical protein NW766_001922 [Fusarium irregulare]
MSTSVVVEMFEFEATNRGSLHTLGLATCVRIAVTGSYSNGSRGNDRFLAHIAEQLTDDRSGYIGLQDYIYTIQDALSNGMEINEIVIVVPDVTRDAGYKPDKKKWQDEKEEQDEFNNAVIEEIEKNNFGEVKIAKHATDTSWELRINADKKIDFIDETEDGAVYETYEEWKAYQSGSESDDEDDDE